MMSHLTPNSIIGPIPDLYRYRDSVTLGIDPKWFEMSQIIEHVVCCVPWIRVKWRNIELH